MNYRYHKKQWKLYMIGVYFEIWKVKTFNSTWNVNFIYFPHEMWKAVIFPRESWSGGPLPTTPPPPPPILIYYSWPDWIYISIASYNIYTRQFTRWWGNLFGVMAGVKTIIYMRGNGTIESAQDHCTEYATWDWASEWPQGLLQSDFSRLLIDFVDN